MEVFNCIYCGSFSSKVVSFPLEISMRAIECKDCGARGPKAQGEDNAKKAWNKRDNKPDKTKQHALF